MAGQAILDFIFGKKALDSAASGAGASPAAASNAAQNPANAQTDMAKQAEEYAKQRKAATPTPAPTVKTTGQKIGDQLLKP